MREILNECQRTFFVEAGKINIEVLKREQELKKKEVAVRLGAPTPLSLEVSM